MAEPHENIADGLRAAMRHVAQGVTVLSAVNDRGERVAMTASAVTSVAMEPPAMLVCVNRDASLYPVLEASLPFCINILPSGMQSISDHCAFGPPGDRRFELGDWRTAPGAWQVPVLEGASANLVCTPSQLQDYGTHGVCIARVRSVQVSPEDPDPLAYVAGGYRRTVDLD